MARVDVRGIRRDQILDAAERLVAEQGWPETTLADLCREADVSNGTLTHSFSSKDEILLALWERCSQQWTRRIEAIYTTGAPLEQALLDVAAQGREKTAAERRLFLLVLHYLAEATSDPELAQRMRELFARTREVSAQRIRRALQAGEVRPDLDPEAAASLIQWACIGLSLGLVTGAADARAAGDLPAMLHLYLTSPARSAAAIPAAT
jgi:TetR/AcrR family transcriptional regulator, transcriptional repressor of aconitase